MNRIPDVMNTASEYKQRIYALVDSMTQKDAKDAYRAEIERMLKVLDDNNITPIEYLSTFSAIASEAFRSIDRKTIKAFMDSQTKQLLKITSKIKDKTDPDLPM